LHGRPPFCNTLSRCCARGDKKKEQGKETHLLVELKSNR
jgi:hypothetical protein